MITALSLAAAGCGLEFEDFGHLDPSGCVRCHGGVEKDGAWVGIEQAHPAVDGSTLSCTDCHGGNPNTVFQGQAHVLPGEDGHEQLRHLASGALDAVDPAYLRFVNPGDLRVAEQSCGSGSGRAGEPGCHQAVVQRVYRNLMTTMSGEMSVIRYRGGMQDSPLPLYGMKSVEDPDHASAAVPGSRFLGDWS